MGVFRPLVVDRRGGDKPGGQVQQQNVGLKLEIVIMGEKSGKERGFNSAMTSCDFPGEVT